jgi:hypothetical protein
VGNEILYPLFGVLVFGFLAWLVVGLFLTNGAIRAAEIRDTGMELVHVHRDFADEWRDMQDERREEWWSQRRRPPDPEPPARSAKPWDRGGGDRE